jgi:hypothetical protein
VRFVEWISGSGYKTNAFYWSSVPLVVKFKLIGKAFSVLVFLVNPNQLGLRK